ncbi:hypothetical protein SPRG_06091 [Saprolegnia parasitica CBS 223.65]|uniref:EGF-like domain-containing protein n=1 Tax=Saprolegnia parasitica (strain CBS 223.65) TaxID=695850 RepID=A0A067CR69_SAPPC|nr:hypothetical protein SPRG_06091 [Saprolegnia parasitica CBS 223.65]KDO29036.1 hypothetical protein SPRG_06091 [Saprolegnia parasitica CBS 223.65]|eukprot:XP_012200206.1 hypothetical protein SPRG_06091 [Saprolegnia parasitica CBS 223.65]
MHQLARWLLALLVAIAADVTADGCEQCRLTGQCAQAVLNVSGHYCGEYYLSHDENATSCCCPTGRLCNATMTTCACALPPTTRETTATAPLLCLAAFFFVSVSGLVWCNSRRSTAVHDASSYVLYNDQSFPDSTESSARESEVGEFMGSHNDDATKQLKVQ